jgi:putative ABC transport system permease protein
MRDWAAAVRERLSGDGPPPNEVVEEIAQHVADVHRAALFKGLSAADADRLAEHELLNVEEIAEAIRRRRHRLSGGIESGVRPLAGLSRDLSHAARLLVARRGYATLVVLTLAVGIGACTAVFSLFNATLLAPLPYPEPERLVLVWESDAEDPSQTFIVSAPNYRDWVNETRSFAALGIWEYLTFNLSGASEPEQVQGVRASASLFEVLGVKPALGRVFTAAEDEPGHRVAVISDATWKVHFGADPMVTSRTVRLNGLDHQVIGVMPPGFEFPYRRNAISTPIQFTTQDHVRRAHSFSVAGRLADGVAFEQARDEVERLGATLRERYPENEGEGATVQRMEEFGLVNTRRVLFALSGAVGLVLLIACVNVASLQLAQGLSRRREFATRLSLGARYSHLYRQVFVEGMLIAALGWGVGIAVAFAATRSIDLILNPGFRNLPFRSDAAVTIDGRVLLFATAASLVSTLLFAFAPLVGLRRQALQPSLREGDRSSTRIASATRRVLVTVEIALAIVVLCGAGLMIRSLSTLLAVDPGFNPQHVLAMQVSLPQENTYGPPVRASFCQDLARETQGIPGVIRASAVSHLPLGGSNAGRSIYIEGRPARRPDERDTSASYRVICPDYFAAFGIPLITGREFSDRDVRDGAQAVIVNRAFVERYFADGKALGHRIKLGDISSTNPWLTIVGIVDNVRHFGLETEPAREIFRPYSQAAWPVMVVVAKTAGEPMAWQRPVRDALKRVELNLPAATARTMDDVVSRSVAWRETPMRLLTGFAIVGLLLAGIGVYGVLAYYVSQRTRELGIRVALGAPKPSIVGLVLRQSAAPVAIGLVLGIAGSLASGRLLSDLLYEVKPGDPVVIAAIAGLLAIVAVLSSWLPARRAATVDPLPALREE